MTTRNWRLVFALTTVLLLRVASPAHAVGGTDNGCIYAFSDTIAPLDGNEPAYSFTDISGSGTPIVLGDDQVSGAIPLGFTFDYYGVSYTDVRVSSNGFLTFLSGQSNGCCTGGPLPNPASPNATISGWWEDLLPGVGAGTVSYQTTGSLGNQVFIAQFTNVNHFSFGTPVTFQFKLFEATDEIEVHYQNAATDFGTHSAGIENQSGTIGIQWQLSSSLTLTNTAVRYYPSPADSDSDTVPDACDICPGVDDNDPSMCTHLYSVSRDDSILRRVNPATGATMSSVAMSAGDVAIEGSNGLAADPRDGTLWTLLKTAKAVTNCDLDPSRTIFAGGPQSEACRQFDGDQASCEAAWHQGQNYQPATCWYDSFSSVCRGCGSNNEQNGECLNTCKGGCPGDPSRTTFAGLAGSSGCRQFDGDQASCLAAWNVGGDGVHASCWWNAGNSQCRGCGANNQDAGLCVNTCPVCDDATRTIYAGGPGTSACHQFDGDQTSCEQAFHTGNDGIASCWYDSGSSDCNGCGTNNESNGECTNTCRTIECPDDPTRTIYAGGPGSGACHQFDGNQASCELAYHLGDGGVASCWYDAGSDECNGCGPNNEADCACVNTCGSLVGRTLASVDPSSGALTVAGNTGLPLAGIAIDCQGEIYGVTGNQGSCDSANPSLYSLDSGDGSATLLTGLLTGTAAGHALAFNYNDGLLYHASGSSTGLGLETIDPGSLDVTPLSPSGNFSGLGQVRALTYDSSADSLLLADGPELFDLTLGAVISPLNLFLDHTSKGLAFDEGNVCGATECGNGVTELGEDCDDGNVLGGDCCSATCTFETAGSSCTDDGDLCTVDKCDGAGTCVSAPPTGCKTALKSILLIKDNSDNAKDKLVFKWLKGQQTNQSDFGNPVTSTNYKLCVYTGGLSTSLLKAAVAADNVKWKPVSDKGYKFKDPAGGGAGVTNVLLKGGAAGKSKGLVKGKGTNLPDPTLGSLPLPVTVQLVNSSTNVCLEAAFDSADIKKNDAAQFKAKAIQ